MVIDVAVLTFICVKYPSSYLVKIHSLVGKMTH